MFVRLRVKDKYKDIPSINEDVFDGFFFNYIHSFINRSNFVTSFQRIGATLPWYLPRDSLPSTLLLFAVVYSPFNRFCRELSLLTLLAFAGSYSTSTVYLQWFVTLYLPWNFTLKWYKWGITILFVKCKMLSVYAITIN